MNLRTLIQKNGLQRQIRKKLEELNKIYERIIACDITLRQQKSEDQNSLDIEAKLLVPKGFLFAEEKAESFEIALNKLTENIKRQLNRLKEKLHEWKYDFDLN